VMIVDNSTSNFLMMITFCESFVGLLWNLYYVDFLVPTFTLDFMSMRSLKRQEAETSEV
jgi:hypothetical protein